MIKMSISKRDKGEMATRTHTHKKKIRLRRLRERMRTKWTFGKAQRSRQR